MAPKPRFQQKLCPGVIITATMPSMVTKASYEAVDFLNEITTQIREEAQEEDEEEAETGAKKRRIDDSLGDSLGGSLGGSLAASLADELAAEVAEIKKSKKNNKKKGWIYDRECEPAKGMAFIRAPTFDVTGEEDAACSTKKRDNEQRNDRGGRSAFGNPNRIPLGNPNLEPVGSGDSTEQNQDSTPASSTTNKTETPAKPEETAPSKPEEPKSNNDLQNKSSVEKDKADGEGNVTKQDKTNDGVKEQNVTEGNDWNVDPKHILREHPWNKPSEVVSRLFAEKKSRYVIRMYPVDYVCSPHLNNFEGIINRRLPKLFETEDKKNDPNNAWCLNFRTLNSSRINKQDCMKMIKKHMPNHMYMDSDARWVIVVHVTVQWMGFAVCDNENEKFREFKLFEDDA